MCCHRKKDILYLYTAERLGKDPKINEGGWALRGGRFRGCAGMFSINYLLKFCICLSLWETENVKVVQWTGHCTIIASKTTGGTQSCHSNHTFTHTPTHRLVSHSCLCWTQMIFTPFGQTQPFIIIIYPLGKMDTGCTCVIFAFLHR